MAEVYDVYSLRAAHLAAHPGSHFFDADTLKFFGEQLSRMRLLKSKKLVKDFSGVTHKCYILSSPQKCPSWTGRGYIRRTKWFYFDVDTLDEVMPG